MSKNKKHKVNKLSDEEYAKYIASITNGKEVIIPENNKE